MKITGQITFQTKTASAKTYCVNAFWSGGPLAKLTKGLLRTHAAYPYLRQTGPSTVLLLQQPLRVIAERDDYLIVARECRQARLLHAYVSTVEYLAEHFPALFGRFKHRLFE